MRIFCLNSWLFVSFFCLIGSDNNLRDSSIIVDADCPSVTVGDVFTVALAEGNHSIYLKYNEYAKFNTAISNVLTVDVKSKSDVNSTENKTVAEMKIDVLKT